MKQQTQNYIKIFIDPENPFCGPIWIDYLEMKVKCLQSIKGKLVDNITKQHEI